MRLFDFLFKKRDEQYFNQGVNFEKLGRHDEAVISFDRATTINPVELYNKAIAIIPNDTDSWNKRGALIGHLYRDIDANDTYETAESIRSKIADAWYDRGIELSNLGRYAEAIVSYDKALSINPNYVIAKQNREIALKKQT